MIKKIMLYTSIVGIMLFLQVCHSQPTFAGTPTEGIDNIQTDNYANKSLDFYYYIPSEVMDNKRRDHPVLVCIPPLSGRGEHSVGSAFKQFADKEGFIIVAPSFVYDQNNWKSRTSYHYPKVWSGNALLQILEKLRKKYGLGMSKLYLHGFSAGAQVALRFALWKPDMCAAVSAHGSGAPIKPQARVPVKFLVSVGQDDKSRIPNAEAFCKNAKNLGIDVRYKIYPGGHNLPTQQIQDTMEFFREVNR